MALCEILFQTLRQSNLGNPIARSRHKHSRDPVVRKILYKVMTFNRNPRPKSRLITNLPLRHDLVSICCTRPARPLWLQISRLLLPTCALRRLRIPGFSLPTRSIVWLRLSTVVLWHARLRFRCLILTTAGLELFLRLRFLTTATWLELVGCAAWIFVLVLASVCCISC